MEQCLQEKSRRYIFGLVIVFMSCTLLTILIANNYLLNVDETTTTIKNATIIEVRNHSTIFPSTISTDDHAYIENRSNVLRLWNEYKQQHSVIALQEEFRKYDTQTTRKFAIGSYNCPYKAGNVLHRFMNDLIWAVVTNRTLLWDYFIFDFGSGWCDFVNTEADCSKILKRADFLPSFKEWNYKMNLPPPEHLPPWADKGNPLRRSYYDNERSSDSDTSNATLVQYPAMWGQNAIHLSTPEGRDVLLRKRESKQRATELLAGGLDFLYGLLLFECFSIQPTLSNPLQIESRNQSQSITVVLHSRHIQVQDDGSNIDKERYCLGKVLNESHHQSSCRVVLMSDRIATLELLSAFLSRVYPHCIVVIPAHDTGESFVSEHGPFAGKGFYQDIYLVNQTLSIPTSTTVFIGSYLRSSSQLIRELMVYQMHQHIRLPDYSGGLLTCFYEDV